MGSALRVSWFRVEVQSLEALVSPRAARSPRIGRRPGQPVAQVRGVLAEGVILSTQLDLFLSLKALARYSGLSVRKLREHLIDPAHPLPCYRVGGKIVVRRSDYDAWAARYRQVGNTDVEKVVAEALRDLRGAA